jgi:hypothetical protein
MMRTTLAEKAWTGNAGREPAGPEGHGFARLTNRRGVLTYGPQPIFPQEVV